MTLLRNRMPGDVAGLEDQLSAMLMATSDEIERMECFDDEQRAEMYTILRALRADTELDRATVELLVRRMSESRPRPAS